MAPLEPALAERLDDYVGDVVRHLPARDRADIGVELRTLLEDALVERAVDAGRAADDAMLLALLRDHGAPRDVAARYRAPGLVIIDAADSARFLRLAIGGVLLQWAITLPSTLGDASSLGRWWLSHGLGALWWPGALVLGMAAAAWWRAPTTVPRAATIELAAIVTGATIVCTLPWLAARLPAPLSSLFAVDGDFLRTRAWPAVPLYAATIAIRVATLRHGRRSRRLRHADAAVTLGWLATLGWWSAGAPVFTARSVDAAAKGALLLCLAIGVATLANTVAMRRPPLAAPRAPR